MTKTKLKNHSLGHYSAIIELQRVSEFVGCFSFLFFFQVLSKELPVIKNFAELHQVFKCSEKEKPQWIVQDEKRDCEMMKRFIFIGK